MVAGGSVPLDYDNGAAGFAFSWSVRQASIGAQCFQATDLQRLLADSTVRRGIGRPQGPFLDLKAESLAFQTAPPQQLWIGLSWHGPQWGGLIVLDCSGRVVGTRSDGFTDSVRVGPQLRGVGKTVLLYAQTGSGSGFTKRELIVLGFSRDSVVPFWRGTTVENDYEMPLSGAQETRREVKVAATNGTIDVSGTYRKLRQGASVNDWVTIETRSLKPETYCWNSKQVHYQLCSPAKDTVPH